MISGLERSPGEGNCSPLQYSGLENSKDCIVYGVAESRPRLSDFRFHDQGRLLLPAASAPGSLGARWGYPGAPSIRSSFCQRERPDPEESQPPFTPGPRPPAPGRGDSAGVSAQTRACALPRRDCSRSSAHGSPPTWAPRRKGSAVPRGRGRQLSSDTGTCVHACGLPREVKGPPGGSPGLTELCRHRERRQRTRSFPVGLFLGPLPTGSAGHKGDQSSPLLK